MRLGDDDPRKMSEMAETFGDLFTHLDLASRRGRFERPASFRDRSFQAVAADGGM